MRRSTLGSGRRNMELIDNITRLLGDSLKATHKPKARLTLPVAKMDELKIQRRISASSTEFE